MTGQWERERQEVVRILEREEFRAYMEEHEGENPLSAWLGRIWEKIKSWLPEGALSDGSYQIIGWCVLVLLSACLLLLLYYAVRNVVRGMRRSRYVLVAGDEEMGMHASQLLEQAEQFAQSGAYAEAVRFRYLALLKQMEIRGWLKARPWKTNREYRMELAVQRADLVPQFEQVTARFEVVYYGRFTATADDYAQMVAVMNRYVQEADELATP